MRLAGFSSHRAVIVAGLAAVAALLLAGTQTAAPAGPEHDTRAQAASGGTVYTTTCQQCHGVSLQGQFQLSFPYGDAVAIFKLGSAAPLAPQPTR